MRYYSHHIGDYDAATHDLTLYQHGIYLRLMHRYYESERPLPNDLQQIVASLARLGRGRPTSDVQMILQRFFQLQDDGWHHKRIDREVARFNDRAPHREAKQTSNAMRQERYRAQRQRFFEALRAEDVVPAFNAPMRELRGLAKALGLDVRQLNGPSLQEFKMNGQEHALRNAEHNVSAKGDKPITSTVTRYGSPAAAGWRAVSVTERVAEAIDILAGASMSVRPDDAAVRRLVELGATRQAFEVASNEGKAKGKRLPWVLYRVEYRTQMELRRPADPHQGAADTPQTRMDAGSAPDATPATPTPAPSSADGGHADQVEAKT